MYSVKRAEKRLRKIGYSIVVPKNLGKMEDGYFAGDAEARAKTILELYRNNDVDFLYALRGGYGAVQILQFLDFHVISTHKKPLVGSSDITILLNTIAQRCGTFTVHAPNILNSTFVDAIQGNLRKAVAGEYFSYTISKKDHSSIRGRTCGGTLV